jgi:hypothetical protein
MVTAHNWPATELLPVCIYSLIINSFLCQGSVEVGSIFLAVCKCELIKIN